MQMIKIARLAYVVLVIVEKCFKTVINSPRKKDREIMAELGERRGTSIYSAFANSCPLQTDTFLFPLIHSHNVILSSNKF